MKENDKLWSDPKIRRRIYWSMFGFGAALLLVYIAKIASSSYNNNRSNPTLAIMDEAVFLKTKMKEVTPKHLKLILQAHVTLINVNIPPGALAGSEYEGVTAEFCPIDWSHQKKDPSSVPMFRDLVEKSPKCRSQSFSLDLATVAQLAREHWELGSTKSPYGYIHCMEPQGFVFHESRCGSTLVANILAASNPSRTRVYSESAPPLSVLQACDHKSSRCRPDTQAKLFQDVIFLMGRTNPTYTHKNNKLLSQAAANVGEAEDNTPETSLFFKIQSAGSLHIQVMRNAFPDTPWIFVYRNPIEVLMSHAGKKKKQKGREEADFSRAQVCLRSQSHPSDLVQELIHQRLGRRTKPKEILPEQYCAAHLASLCESAIREHERSGTGRLLNYERIEEEFVVNNNNSNKQKSIASYFDLDVTESSKMRMAEIMHHYSKGSRGRDREWAAEGDSQAKQERAGEHVRMAADLFLTERYEKMENF